MRQLRNFLGDLPIDGGMDKRGDNDFKVYLRGGSACCHWGKPFIILNGGCGTDDESI